MLKVSVQSVITNLQANLESFQANVKKAAKNRDDAIEAAIRAAIDPTEANVKKVQPILDVKAADARIAATEATLGAYRAMTPDSFIEVQSAANAVSLWSALDPNILPALSIATGVQTAQIRVNPAA